MIFINSGRLIESCNGRKSCLFVYEAAELTAHSGSLSPEQSPVSSRGGSCGSGDLTAAAAAANHHR